MSDLHGSIYASCGHKLTEAEDFGIDYRHIGDDCDYHGISRVVFYGSCCTKCWNEFYKHYHVTEEEGERWMDKGVQPERFKAVGT